MFEIEYIPKFNDNFIQFLQGKRPELLILCELYKCKSWNFSKFIPKIRVFSEEVVHLDNLLAGAYLSR